MERFEEILWGFGELINTSLHADENRACKIVIDEQISIQFEMDGTQERLLIATFITEVPPGKYREILFKEALQANSLRQPKCGVFAYVERNNSLVLFDYLIAKTLTGPKLTDFLEPFIEKAKAWKNAIEGGRPAPIEYLPQGSTTKSSIFDIKK